jgi:hypothetical protein
MAVTLAYALLFGVMRFLQAPPALIGFVSLFITLVGLGQALLFRGRHPRAASLVAGILAWSACAVLIYAWDHPGGGTPRPGYWTDLLKIFAISAVCPGAILSYLTGTLVAGLFLVADVIRRLLRRMIRPKPVGTGDWAEPAPGKAVVAAPGGHAGRGPGGRATMIGDDESAGV